MMQDKICTCINARYAVLQNEVNELTSKVKNLHHVANRADVEAIRLNYLLNSYMAERRYKEIKRDEDHCEMTPVGCLWVMSISGAVLLLLAKVFLKGL